MKQILGKSFLLFSAGAMSAGACWYYAYGRLSRVQRYTFSFDTCLASHVRDGVVNLIGDPSLHHAKGTALGRSGFDNLSQIIHKKFPSVSSLSFERSAPGVVHCSVQGAHPLVSVNRAFIVADSGALLTKDVFTQRSTQFLFDVTVPRAIAVVRMPQEFVESVRYFMPNFFTNYTVTWLDEKEIWLREKDQQFAIVCNADALPNERMLSYCERLKNDALAAMIEKKGRKQQWAADIRFEHQLILFADKEGVGHG